MVIHIEKILKLPDKVQTSLLHKPDKNLNDFSQTILSTLSILSFKSKNGHVKHFIKGCQMLFRCILLSNKEDP